jgi:hypothetical protein
VLESRLLVPKYKRVYRMWRCRPAFWVSGLFCASVCSVGRTDVSLISGASIFSSAVKMETLRSTDTLVTTYQSRWCQRCGVVWCGVVWVFSRRTRLVCSEKHRAVMGDKLLVLGSAKFQGGP